MMDTPQDMAQLAARLKAAADDEERQRIFEQVRDENPRLWVEALAQRLARIQPNTGGGRQLQQAPAAMPK